MSRWSKKDVEPQEEFEDGVFIDEDILHQAPKKPKGRMIMLAGGIALAVGVGGVVAWTGMQKDPQIAQLVVAPGKCIPTLTPVTPGMLTDGTIMSRLVAQDSVLDPSIYITADEITAAAMPNGEGVLAPYRTYAEVCNGEPLTRSVVDEWQKVEFKYPLPKGYQAAAIFAAPQNAVAGNISAGNYVDVYVPADALVQPVGTAPNGSVPGSASYPSGANPVAGDTVQVSAPQALRSVLVLDTYVQPAPINAGAEAAAVAEAPGVDSPELKGGVAQVYVLMVTAEEARILSNVANGNGAQNGVYMTLLSPEDVDLVASKKAVNGAAIAPSAAPVVPTPVASPTAPVVPTPVASPTAPVVPAAPSVPAAPADSIPRATPAR